MGARRQRSGAIVGFAKVPGVGTRDADFGDGLRVITVGERNGLRRARGAEALGREQEAGRIESNSLQNSDLGDEGIAVATIGGLERIRQGEVERARLAGDVGRSRITRIHGDAVSAIGVAAAQISRVDQGGAGGIQFGNKSIGIAAAIGSLEDGAGGREVSGNRGARHVGIFTRVQGNAVGGVRQTAPQVSKVD